MHHCNFLCQSVY